MRTQIFLAVALTLLVASGPVAAGSTAFADLVARQIGASADEYCHLLVACAPNPTLKERAFVFRADGDLCGGVSDVTRGYSVSSLSARGRGTQGCLAVDGAASPAGGLSGGYPLDDDAGHDFLLGNEYGSLDLWVHPQGAFFGACESGLRDVTGPFVVYGTMMGEDVALYAKLTARVPC